jgi:DNA modification methylase
MIILGDCLQELPKINSESVDLIITDPPYLISRSSNFKQISQDTPKEMATKYNISIDFGDWDKIELDFRSLFREWSRILRKGGTLIVFYDIWKSNEIKEAAEEFDFKQPRVCAWIKTNPVPINSKINYLSNATEYFFTFVKDSKPVFNSEYDNGFYKYPICHGKERLKHPTQKPLSLITNLIEKHSNIGDIVLDNFAGTGTVGEACQRLQRDFILIEKEELYFEMMKNRLNNLSIK